MTGKRILCIVYYLNLVEWVSETNWLRLSNLLSDVTLLIKLRSSNDRLRLSNLLSDMSDLAKEPEL